MNNFASLVLPAILGIITGVGHGIISHKADLPVSLTEQVALPLQIGQFPEP
ncbi:MULTISPECIES: hypothetical protein [unclassified Okeania]|uniref:hypothetical protein n=1 Tax=unclassified Okeania TaxID=2634635 RepID=UPI0025E41F6D|nr:MULTISPECIES: hypothetical protein [unclassified Okeania]